MPDDRPIGVFDSGVGGLTIVREIDHQFPNEDILYFADTAHCPYGARSEEEIRQLSHAIAEFLLRNGAKIIVVACNTASVASLSHLRASFGVPFVGIVPAVKPAAQTTQSKCIGVLATNATFQGAIFDDLVAKFASNVNVVRQVCPGWVELVERGQVDGPEVEEAVRKYIAPLMEKQVDTVVLGCTHYPFLRPVIERLVGDGVSIIDPAPAIARQVGRVMDANDLHASRSKKGEVRFFTTGDAERLTAIVSKLTGWRAERVEQVRLNIGSAI